MSAAVAAAASPPPPPPEEPLTYPITFLKLADEASLSQHLQQVTIFTAPAWLLPIYAHADWAEAYTSPHHNPTSSSSNNNNTDGAAQKQTPIDVLDAQDCLQRLDKFFVEGQRILPQHKDLYYFTESLTLPTPKGPKVITRSKVEGDYRAVHQASHAPSTAGAVGATTKSTVTNSTAYFSLLPGHNQFLLYYEPAEKLRHFNYLELDKLRFLWVAVKELLDEHKVLNLHDGSVTAFAKRDLKKNNAASPFCLSAAVESGKRNTKESASSGGGSGGGGGGGGGTSAVNNGNAPGSGGANVKGAAVVGRGGGNARLHQGTSGNVITGPNKDVLAEKRRMQEMRFLREKLEQECQTRWPYTPVAKSCIFSVEEKAEVDLPADALAQLGLVGAHNVTNGKTGAKRRGPRYFLATVELPLLNKKGGSAKFKSPQWFDNRRDAESAAAEATLFALHNLKL